MSDTAAELIRRLDLAPHPEGGHYREIYRSVLTVTPADGRGSRNALTTIYFLLRSGDLSRWHRVRSEEVWHYYAGGTLELLCASADFADIQVMRLDAFGAAATPVAIVPAGHWQAARPLFEYALVGCTVGPGFAFEDFVMLRNDTDACALLEHRHPSLLQYA